MQAIRLFVAVELPDFIKEALAKVHFESPGLKRVSPESMHLTLRFIGEQPSIIPFQKALGAVRSSSFSLSLARLGSFKSHQRTVVWAGLRDEPGLELLKSKVDGALCSVAGLPPDNARFSPHITLGRLSGPVPKGLCKHIGDKDFAFPSFWVSHFTLFSSTLTSGGAVHKVEERYALEQS